MVNEKLTDTFITVENVLVQNALEMIQNDLVRSAVMKLRQKS